MQKPFVSVLACLFACGVLVGCGGQEDDTSTCMDVLDPCERLDQERCNAQLGGIDVCAQDDEGCLYWEADESCAERQQCQTMDEGPACVCDNGCDTEGATFCRSRVILACRADENGCLFVEVDTDCESTGQTCESFDGSAECVGCIEHGCQTRGQRRCSGDAVEECARSADGCLEWEELTTCDDDEECEQEGFRAECVRPCSDRCDRLGDSRCNVGGDVETCRPQSNGCLDWDETDACDGELEYCEAVDGDAACFECVNECEAAGETRCLDHASLETCEEDETTGCLAWGEAVDCSPLFCLVVEEEAGCVEVAPGDGCLTAIDASELPYTLEGEAFTDDFTDMLELLDESCVSRTGTVEAVLLVSLTAGQTLLMRELGELDVVLSMQEASCAAAEVCVISEGPESDETIGHRYTAEADLDVFVIVEADSDAPEAADYEIHLDLVLDEVCDDDEDNDFDGDVDCLDDDCSESPSCAT